MSRMTSSHRGTRRRLLVGSIGLVIAALAGSAGGAMAAGSPSEAVETLVDRVVSGDFEDLSGVVCPELEDEIRSEFDPAASDATFGTVSVDIADPVVMVVSEEAGRAQVNLTGTMHITFDEEQAREFVRAQLEASGQDASDASVDAMLGLMTSFASEDLPIDEDLTVVEQDGDWVICDTAGSESAFTEAGICGLATPEEISALSPVAIISNVGEGDYCQWIGADDANYFSIDVGLLRDASLDDYRAADPSAVELTVGGLPAVGSIGQLYVAVDGGVLTVLPYLADGPDPNADPIALATTIAELFIPRLGQLGSSDPGAVSQPSSEGVGLADCADIDLDALNALSSLRYDSVSGGAGSCTFVSSDLEAGAPVLGITLDPTSSIDSLAVLFPDGTEGDVDGHPTFAAMDSLWVQTDGGLLTVTPFFAASPDAAAIDAEAYAADVARLVIAALAGEG